MLKVLDLFAGAGGLSYGFERTGNYEVCLAVEFNSKAANTYRKNHNAEVIEDDIRNIDFKSILHEKGNIDVVIGGPPCQGFSNANRQKFDLISGNNQLVKEYIRAIEEIKPSAFLMENVKSIASPTHKFYAKKNESKELSELEIEHKIESIVFLENNIFSDKFYSHFKSKDTKMLKLEMNLLQKEQISYLKSLKRCSSVPDGIVLFFDKKRKETDNLSLAVETVHTIDSKYNKALEEINSAIKNRDINVISTSKFQQMLMEVIDFSRALLWMNEVIENDLELVSIENENGTVLVKLRSYNVIEFVEARFKALGYSIKSNILNASNFGVPQYRERFILIGVKKTMPFADKLDLPESMITNIDEMVTIREALVDLAKYPVSTAVREDDYQDLIQAKDNKFLRVISDSDQLHNHVVTESSDYVIERFKSLNAGQNFHDLVDDLKTTYSNPTRTQNTIYQRLDYDKLSDTVVNVRKSMWIHPELHRAVSIREAARLQSFPDSFVFLGTKDSQYQQIGNAVPPLLGWAIAESLLKCFDIKPNESLYQKFV